MKLLKTALGHLFLEAHVRKPRQKISVLILVNKVIINLLIKVTKIETNDFLYTLCSQVII